MLDPQNGARTLSWPAWWAGYSSLYEEANSQRDILRQGLKVLRSSMFAKQFYCEQQLQIQLTLRERSSQDWEHRTSSQDVKGRDDGLALGVRGHEKIASGSPTQTAEDLWRCVIAGRAIRLHDPLLLGKFEGILLTGHPDVIQFANQVPQLLIEYKFSAKKIPSPHHDAQTRFYCYLLEALGFNVNALHTILCIIPPDSHNSDGLTSITESIVARFPFDRTSVALSDGTAYLYAHPYIQAKMYKELRWAVEFWRGEREAVPTRMAWKCRACFAQQICQFASARTRI